MTTGAGKLTHEVAKVVGFTAWCICGQAFSLKGIRIHIGMMNKKAK